MSLMPEFDFSPLHGLILVLPLLFARIVMLRVLRRDALQRADFTPPAEEGKGWAIPLYVLCEGLLLVYPFFLTIKSGGWLALGLPLMLAGLIVVALSAWEFARSDRSEPLTGGIYRYSRNPMYVGFLLYYAGVGLMTASWLYIVIAFVYQFALYWLIRGEERWCLAEYGEPYRQYAAQVRRYVGRR